MPRVFSLGALNQIQIGDDYLIIGYYYVAFYQKISLRLNCYSQNMYNCFCTVAADCLVINKWVNENRSSRLTIKFSLFLRLFRCIFLDSIKNDLLKRFSVFSDIAIVTYLVERLVFTTKSERKLNHFESLFLKRFLNDRSVIKKFNFSNSAQVNKW